MLTTKALAIEAYGEPAVRNYEDIKAFYMRLGEELARGFCAAVDGRVGAPGEADVHTTLGAFEFCASHNTKNHAGTNADELRGYRVQATGKARRGYISGEQFLQMHQRDPKRADRIRLEAAIRALVHDQQLRFDADG